MTTGSVRTGTFPNGGTTKIHYAKAWTGGDGKTITGRVSRKSKWNGYVMATQKFRSSQPNQIGLRRVTPPGAYELRTNASWATGGGSDPLARGYATFGNGSISSTFPTSLFNSVWTASEELRLLAKLRQKVIGHSYDMGVSLAEVDKLATTVVGTIKTLGFGVMDLRKGDFTRFARRFGTSPPGRETSRRLQATDISGRFLEMRYAWQPAVSDVFEAAKAFEALSNGPRQQVFKASSRKSRSPRMNTNYGFVQQQLVVKRQYTYEMYEELSAFRQMGLGNPATILWERIPWSFVVDWFIPVGTYLSVIGQVPFMKGRWMRSSSVKTICSGSAPMDPSVSGLTNYESLPPTPSAEFTLFNLERTVSFSAPPVPRPNLRVAGAVQGARIGNAVALAHQLFAGASRIPLDRGSSPRGTRPKVNALRAIAYQLGRV